MTGRRTALVAAGLILGLAACDAGGPWRFRGEPEVLDCLELDLDDNPSPSGAPSGIFHVPIGFALRGGMQEGHELREAWTTLAHSSLIDGGWLLAGRLADGDTAVWLSELPNGAVYTSTGDEGVEAMQEWAAAPWEAPEHTHLFSVDDTARAVSVWRELGDITVPAEPIALVRRCAEEFAS